MELSGRKQIILPITEEDFQSNEKQAILNFLSSAISIHNKNVEEIEYLHKQYVGLQDILTDKTRPASDDINNKEVENHLFKQVNFKVGFMYGNPLEYTILNSDKIDVNDIAYLNAYLIDCSKSSLDIEKAQDLYEYGIAYQRLFPRRNDFDPKVEAPFELDNMDVKNTFIAYSCDTPPKQLFGCVIGKKTSLNPLEINETKYNIYLPYKKYEVDETFKTISEPKQQPFGYIPIEEFCLNKDRIGIVEVVVSLQNLLNKIDSGEMDGIEENINSFLVFYNQRIDADNVDEFIETVKKLRKQRILGVETNDPQRPAKVDILSTSVKNETTQLFYERIKKAMYDIVAVPMASGNVTSGGDTGKARELGNGWEASQNQGKVDQTYLLKFERKLLKDILWICRQTSNCPISSIYPSDVAIKFNINMSDNLYMKTESLKMLSDITFPEKQALSIVGLTNDIDGVGDAWIKKKEEIANKEQEEQPNDNNNLE